VLSLSLQPDHSEVIDDEQVMLGEFPEKVGLPPFEMDEAKILNKGVNLQ